MWCLCQCQTTRVTQGSLHEDDEEQAGADENEGAEEENFVSTQR
jgi:hypothetical protein